MTSNTLSAFIIAAALALPCITLSGTSQAAVLTGTSAAAANTVTDYSSAGQVSFDLDLATFAPTRLEFVIEEADLLGPLSLNAIIRNLSGTALTGFEFTLGGISFAQAGSVTPTFGTLGQVGNGASYATIVFSAPEWAEFQFGNPLAETDATDWLLSTAGLRAGDTFSITAEVPEPPTPALMLSALCMSGLLAWRRRRG